MMNKVKVVPIISVVFFLSGCSALIFEIVWFRIASTVLGSSVWSATAVLMAFMGGLAIGNGLMATYGHRVNNPVRFYLYIEAVIGLSGFLIVLLLPKLTPIIGTLLFNISESQGILLASRFLIACLFFLLPAIAMGATLPVMQKLVQEYDDSFINSISRLYGWNTIGAVFGVLFAEFVLIEFFGVISTAAVACTFNLLVILIMLRLFKGLDQTTIKEDKGKFQKNITRYLVAAFLTGMLLLALEVVWFRYLLVARTGTSVIFAIMLSIVLVGIGFGGLIISRLKLADRYINKATYFLPISASIFTILGFYLFQRYFNENIFAIMGDYNYFIFGACLLIFPTSLISGMIFPLLGECVYRKNLVATSSVGYLTLANTIGAVIGSAITTFYLLPELGIEKTIYIIVIIYLFISLLLVENIKTEIIGLLAAAVFIIALFPHGLVKKSYDKVYESFLPNHTLIKFREGLNQSIAYLEKRNVGRRSEVRLVTNNYSMSATSFQAQRYMRLYSYFPYLFNNDIENVLQISYGVGNTAESIIMLPDMKHFDVVDMSPDILELSELVHEGTGVYPLRDKRTIAHIEDGRFFLQTTKNKYDLITAEPPPPKVAGVVNLYTQEYFQLIYDALQPDGITTYWLPLHSLLESDALSIIKAFCNVFNDCSLWNGARLSFMLVGSKSGLSAVSETQLAARWNSKMIPEFSKVGFDTPEQVFATYIGDHVFLEKLTVYSRPLTDNHPQRIKPYGHRITNEVNLYNMFLNIKRREESFINSNYVKRLFPGKIILDVANEFQREGIASYLSMDAYKSSLVKSNFNHWDTMLESMSKGKRDVVMLLAMKLNPAELEDYDVVFSSNTGRDAYKFEYIEYLFVEKEYELLEAEVNSYINEHKDKANYRYAVYAAFRLYLLTKIYKKETNMDDVLISMELSKDMQKDGFNLWAINKIFVD